MEQIIFFFVSFLALASAFYFVFARNAMYAILSLIVTFFSIAALYILLNAQFLAIWIQTTVMNFPMALLLQFFFAGPITRRIFGALFREKNAAPAPQTERG